MVEFDENFEKEASSMFVGKGTNGFPPHYSPSKQM